jgi:hypothetical protein
MLTIILLVLALVCFILAVANVPKINWVALGLAFIVVSWLLPAIGVHA